LSKKNKKLERVILILKTQELLDFSCRENRFSDNKLPRLCFILPPIHRPSKILNRLSKTMHSAASLRKKGKTLSLPLHAHSKHMGRRKVLLGQGIF
ncbi:MAG: hypothetical protein VX385_05825, partial [Acidobacteriota bacterium]|nr:hypothetical protein [Acidobacteriota bacterium]